VPHWSWCYRCARIIPNLGLLPNIPDAADMERQRQSMGTLLKEYFLCIGCRITIGQETSP